MNEIAINPRQILDRFAQSKRTYPFRTSLVDEIDESVIPITTGNNRVNSYLSDRLLGKRRHVIADEDEERRGLQCLRGLEALDPFPMTLYDGRLRFDDHEVGCESTELLIKLITCHLRRDAIEKEDIVSRFLEHRRRGRRHDGKDVGRTREPLELSVLG